MINLKKRGLFIVFEGLDRCGKSTQCKLLAEKLNSKGKAVLHSFPSKLIFHSQIVKIPLELLSRNIQVARILCMTSQFTSYSPPIDGKTCKLVFSKLRNYIRDTLEEGTHVICDRYCFSGVAYSAAKGLDREWCENSDRGLLVPDLVVYIDTALDTIYSRKGFGDEKYQKKEFIQKVQEQYNALLERKFAYWRVIDGNTTVERIAEEIQKEINEKLSEEKLMDLSETLFK